MINRRDLMTGSAAVAGVAMLLPASAGAKPYGETLPTRIAFLRREYDWASSAALDSLQARNFSLWAFGDPFGNPPSFTWRLSGAYVATGRVFGPDPFAPRHPVMEDYKRAFLDILEFTEMDVVRPGRYERFFADHPAALIDRIASVRGGAAERRAAIAEGLALMGAWYRKTTPPYVSGSSSESKLMFYSREVGALSRGS